MRAPLQVAAAPAPVASATIDDPKLDVFGTVGLSYRIGDSATGVPVDTRAGALLGAGAMVGLARWVSLGASYDHTALGRERSGSTEAGSVETTRDVHTLWGRLRVYPARNEVVGVYVSLAPGLAWQTATSSYVLPQGPLFASRQTTTSCSGSDSANFALSAGVGIDVSVGGGVVLTGETSFDDRRLTSGSIGECGVSGAGTTAAFGARVGLGYRFDLSGKPAPAKPAAE